MTNPARTRLAVLGSPIAHSLSPALHSAAYRVLGLPWSYEAVDIDRDTLSQFLDSCTQEWRGLSLTMPLKRDVLPLLDSMDDVAELTGVANTLLFDDGVRRGYNTDVHGITRSFQQAGVTGLRDVVVLGGGATAISALVAVTRLGARRIDFVVRTAGRAGAITELGSRLGVDVGIHEFTDGAAPIGDPDAIISTLPAGSVVDLVYPPAVRRRATLLDVAYDPWPTPLAASWLDAGGRVVPGLDMLIYQALIQVRIFVSGDPEAVLPDEGAVLAAMIASVRT